jgi:hypothetical protein
LRKKEKANKEWEVVFDDWIDEVNWLSTLDQIPGNSKTNKEKKMSIQEVIQDAIEEAGISSEVDAARFREMMMGEVSKATGQAGSVNRQALSDEFSGQVAKLRSEGRSQADIEALRRHYRDHGMGQVSAGSLSANKITEIAGQVSAQFRAQQYREEMQSAQGNPKKVRQVKETWKARGLDVDHTSLY